MSQVARELQVEHTSVEATLQAITSGAVDEVPGAEHAGISLLIGRRQVQNRAATSPIAAAIDGLQTETGQGPCLQSFRNEVTVRIDDMATEPRWPLFASRAADLGVGSMLSFHLFVHAENLGALNLCAAEPGAFDRQSEETGLIFAAHAAIALIGARREERLMIALDSRDIIGQAKGILMERYQISPDRAFAVLVRVSQRTNVKMRDVAAQLSDTGHLDEEFLPPELDPT